MARLSKEDLTIAFGKIIGDRNDDEVIKFYEDFNDSWPEIDTSEIDELRAALADKDTEIANLDAAWRQRYIDRFNGKTESDPPKDDESDEDKPKTYDELFKEEK